MSVRPSVPPKFSPSPLISDALRSPTAAPGSAQTASAKKPTGAELWNPSVKVRVIKEHDFRRYFHVEKGIGKASSPRAELQLRAGSAGSDLFIIPFYFWLLPLNGCFSR